jgi:hypothetical protein
MRELPVSRVAVSAHPIASATTPTAGVLEVAVMRNALTPLVFVEAIIVGAFATHI